MTSRPNKPTEKCHPGKVDSNESGQSRWVIIGAGPAGLTAAAQALRQGIQPLVLEASGHVGGIARTEVYKGYRFDIGGHRFYTKVKAIERLWREVMGADFLKVKRLSRILYDGKFYKYPLSPWDTFRNLGLYESVRILLSYLKWRIRPHPEEDTLDQWVTNRFGGRLYITFFKTYTEKVWGIPCHEIRADWAAQRIRGLSLTSAVLNALFGIRKSKSLIEWFDYPRLGPGMMWERFRDLVNEAGGEVRLNARVSRILRKGFRVESLVAEKEGVESLIAGPAFISSMPLGQLVQALEPPAPVEVREAAAGLRYRDFLVVGLIVNRANLFPDNWIYIHSPDVRVGRIQNFKNWSEAMIPDPAKSSLGLEYFCSRGDGLWESSDAELIQLAKKELTALGLAKEAEVEDGVVIRQPKAYPIYDSLYRERVTLIGNYLDQFENLQTIGRNGMHRYNNQDHSMLTGILAVKNLLGETHDLWSVNTERSYYEEFQVDGSAEKRGG